MNLKAHAKHILGLSRRMTEGIISQLNSEDDWFYQAHPKVNHALWVVGHLGLADNMFASKFREHVDHKPPGFEDVFWFGSEISSDRSKYPPVDEVLAYLRDRRETLLKVLDDLSDDELNAAAPPEGERSAVAGAPCVGQLFIFAAYHEGLHTGQLTVCHRGLGHPPMFRPENVPAGDGA